MKAIPIKEKLRSIKTHWHPHQIAVVDDMQVLLAKISDEFVWHQHAEEDELFLVQKGTLEMHFRTPAKGSTSKQAYTTWVEIVKEGELIVVPKGMEHCPKTKDGQEVHLLLFEKLTTRHTGNVTHERTKTVYPKL